MVTTNLYLDCRGKAKDSRGTVLILIYHKHTTTSISTNIRLQKNEWDKQKQKAINHIAADAINIKLQDEKAKVDKAIAVLSLDPSFEEMTAAELKREIKTGMPKKITGHLVKELFQEYIRTGNLKPTTKSIYDITLDKVMKFGGEYLRAKDLTLKWLRAFDSYLAETQSVNGRSIYLRALRAVCNYAVHEKMMNHYPFENFQIKSEETMKRSVSVEKLREFMNYPTDSYKARYRDYFFLMFYLIGINAKDLFLAKKSQVNNGRLVYQREKTGKKYSIKIQPEAEALLTKYEGKNYLVEAMDSCKDYKNFLHMMNDALKQIGPVVETQLPATELFEVSVTESHTEPVIPDITSYFSRHCWATFAYEIGISMDIISQAMGHSFGNRTTMIYVKPDQGKVDEANRKVIDYLLARQSE